MQLDLRCALWNECDSWSLRRQRQIILTCDRYPKEVNGLEERLKSRFGWLAIAAAEIDPAADLDEVALPYNFEVLLFSQFKFSNSQLLSCTQDLPQGTTKPVIPLPARPSFAAWGVPLGSKSELAPVNVHKERPPEADKLIELGASEVDNMTSKVEANGDRGSSSGCESGANVAGIDGNNFAGGAESGYGFLMAEPLTRPVTRETPDTHENLGNQDAHDTMVESFTKPTIGSVLPYQEDPKVRGAAWWISDPSRRWSVLCVQCGEQRGDHRHWWRTHGRQLRHGSEHRNREQPPRAKRSWYVGSDLNRRWRVLGHRLAEHLFQ